MAFCIMRTAKLKEDGNVGASVSHALRTRETPNADKAKTPDNWCCYNFTDEKGKTITKEDADKIAMAEYRKRLPQKVRKNGVRAIELMLTASPEAFQEKKINPIEYLNKCDSWVKKTFGAKNIFLITHHYDELTPHSSILLVPTDPKGKLNCRHFLGGGAKLRALQDSFFEQVGQKFGLERGVKGSKARHQTVKQFYTKLEQLDKAIEPPAKKMLESFEQYSVRYKAKILPLLQKHEEKVLELSRDNLTLKSNLNAVQRRLEALESDLKREMEKVNQWESASPKQLINLATKLQNENFKSWSDKAKHETMNTKTCEKSIDFER